MTEQQALLTIAAIAAGAVGRHLAPATVQKIRPTPKPKSKPAAKPASKPPEYVTMFDSTNISAIGRLASTSPDAIAAYDDGDYDNIDQARRDYPGHHVYSIAVHEQDAADFYDIEPGCIWPPSKVVGILERRRAERATFIGLYGDVDTWQQILALPVELAGVCLWIADQTGVPHIPPHFQGCQYSGSAMDPRLQFDVSLFYASALR